MSFQATHDVLMIMLGIEKRKLNKTFEIPEVETVIRGLSEQIENHEKTGYFHVGRQTYIGYVEMLSAQRDFSGKHDGITFEHEWDLPKLLPEVQKVIELLERFRTHEETPEDTERAISYLAVLHQHLIAQQTGRRRGCFG